ncbi:MAG: type II secretion system protein [Candidatus Gastranaerophilales bacterium]
MKTNQKINYCHPELASGSINDNLDILNRKNKADELQNIISNLQTFDCDENTLLNRIQGGNRIPLNWNASEQRQKAKPSAQAGVIPLRWRGDREVGVVSMAKRSAFTLAEVLITLGIIGVVAAMTMPSLISNMQSKALERKQELFDGRLEEAMNQMRFHEKLTGYTSAMDFVETLGGYIKINEVCDNDELTECFPETITTELSTLVVEDDLATGSQMVMKSKKDKFTSDNVSVIFADGVSALVNYQDSCDWLDPYDGGANRGEASNCISMVYDLNGKKGKNTLNSDIMTLNAQIECSFILSNGTCATTTPVMNSTAGYLTSTQCEAQKNELGINECYYNTDYWAGAIAYCGGVSNMPTLDDLELIAIDVYGTSSAGSGVTPDGDKLTNTYGFSDPTSDVDYGIWTGDEYSSEEAYRYRFGATSIYSGTFERCNGGRWVFCVE